MSVPITIAIPVGPHPSNVQWLHEALESIEAQTELPGEVLLIDDGAHLDPQRYPGCRIWATPWPSGVAHAFNYGVALASYDLVIMLGSDDRLLIGCVARCWQEWQAVQDPHGYYAMPVVYDDGREQLDPCNAAMVHKELWKLTGGFPVEAAIGACDTWLISKIWVGKGTQGNLYTVGDRPLYWYRDHSATDTHARGETWGLLGQYRDLWLRRPYRQQSRDAYRYWLEHWSDVQTHLPVLYEAARGNVLELGVRAGVSTCALLAGVADHGGHVWSVDINDCRPAIGPHPDWTFIQADSCDEATIRPNLPGPLDCLFIDTEHTEDRTIRELRTWGDHVRRGGIILLHDTDDMSTYPGVRRAIEQYSRETGRTPEYREGSYGLGVIRC